MEKTFITNQFILTLKQYKEITKLTTGHGEDYTTRCQLNDEYIKKSSKIILIDLSRQN